MENRKIRIGIDVGGTFTHAVALDNGTYEVIAHAVTPTTHTSRFSVSEGIIKSFRDVLRQTGAEASDVVFVAHSTTQATNALLEGDVAKVGIIGMGRGIEGVKAKADTTIGDIPLSENKALHTATVFLNSEETGLSEESVRKAIEELQGLGCEVIVASEAFGVDNTSNEDMVTAIAAEMGLPATASHEISQLYGLKIRTRTAVINASILPKMTRTAQMTEESVRSSGITAPLMIMRSDGGVMDIEQMKKRPIMTMLSGPAAGIAAALMHENVSDGIFLEVGGTSTDISAIHNGKAMIKSASVGGHSTYLKTLDSRTVGIGGGSMVRMDEGGRVVDVGPRSAHIAGLSYLAFAREGELEGAFPVFASPVRGDSQDHLLMENPEGKRFAVTLTDAAMMAGVVKEGDYAFGNYENVRSCFEKLGNQFHVDPRKLAEEILDRAIRRVNETVQDLLRDYKLDPALLSLVGGGGGCCTVVPWLSKKCGIRYVIADKAEIISAIGAAMAMLRDVVARNIVNPSSEDIMKVRREAADSLVRMGADPATIQVQMEIDQQKNIVQATAVGSLWMEKRDLGQKPLEDDEMMEAAAKAFHAAPEEIRLSGRTEGLSVFSRQRTKKKLFGLLSSREEDYRVLNQFGVVRLQINHGDLLCTTAAEAIKDMDPFLQENSSYSDAGQIAPEVFLICAARITDLSSVLDQRQILDLAAAELENVDALSPVCVITKTRK